MQKMPRSFRRARISLKRDKFVKKSQICLQTVAMYIFTAIMKIYSIHGFSISNPSAFRSFGVSRTRLLCSSQYNLRKMWNHLTELHTLIAKQKIGRHQLMILIVLVRQFKADTFALCAMDFIQLISLNLIATGLFDCDCIVSK